MQPLIMVVDDDEAILDVVEWALEDEGYAVQRARDGAAALRLLESSSPALILLDMRMPGMNGWEFAAAYRAFDGRRAPFVVMSAAHDAGPVAAELGADGYLTKPFDVEEMLAVVRKYSRHGGQ
jgi:two-component system, chemotaxis family, chemotaxis protein CheY